MSAAAKSTPEERKAFLAFLQSDADGFEKAGDVKGWIRAMRRLSGHADWRNSPPASIPVVARFFQAVEDYQDGPSPSRDIGRLGTRLYFRRTLIHPEAVCG